MFNRRIRILSGLLIAFIVVNFYGRLSKTPFISPAQANNIKSNVKNLLSNIKFNPNSFVRLFTINLDSDDSKLVSRLDAPSNSFNLPTVPPSQIEPATIQPTGSSRLTPTIPLYPTNKITPTIKVPTKIPTKVPTKVPKPTKVPELPPVTSDTRPGNSLMEIFQEINKRECVPVAFLMAIKTLETGERFKNDNASTIKTYNTYGWWKTGAGDPCYGYGYYTQTGIVPSDSVNAGTKCSSAVGSTTDIKIMGIEQISEWEQEVSRKYTIKTLPDNIDRRVLFDNALIFAIITKNRVGNPPADCDNWPDDAIRTAAEKHHGVCKYDYGTGNSGDYCEKALKLYKEYQ